MKLNNIEIIEYDPMYAEDTVTMWRQSKEKAIGQKDKRTFIILRIIYFS